MKRFSLCLWCLCQKILEFHACLCHIVRWLSSQWLCTDCSFQCSTTDLVLIYLIVFLSFFLFLLRSMLNFMLWIYCCSSQCMPYYKNPTGVQINVYILMWWYRVVYSQSFNLFCCWLFTTHMHGDVISFFGIISAVCIKQQKTLKHADHVSKCICSPHMLYTGSWQSLDFDFFFFFFYFGHLNVIYYPLK